MHLTTGEDKGGVRVIRGRRRIASATAAVATEKPALYNIRPVSEEGDCCDPLIDAGLAFLPQPPRGSLRLEGPRNLKDLHRTGRSMLLPIVQYGRHLLHLDLIQHVFALRGG